MKTIGVTSPLTVSDNVERVQRLLKRNWTGTDFLQGPVDRAFGPQTGRACTRAKYWLGYIKAAMLPVAGDELVRYLTAEKNLPKRNADMRRRRIAESHKTPLRALALARAERDLGMTEKPRNSNECPITKRWGLVGPWCNMAVSVWYIDAGSKAFREHVDWAYVPFFLYAAEHGLSGIAIVRPEFARPGDPVCFDWDDDGVADHIGLLRTNVTSSGAFKTIEGNTAVGNDSNGGEVMHRERKLADVASHGGVKAFVRVGR